MQITFYSTDDWENVINKTLSEGVTIPIHLKRETDILSPVLTLTNKTGIDYTQFNYCYIDVLKRFYFIRTVRQLNSALFHVELSCDVLETYKERILVSKARFKRKIKTGDYYNASIDDSTKQTINTYNGNVTISLTTQNYILTSLGV